jgi:hypothetical protein
LVISNGKDSKIEDNSKPNISKLNIILIPKKEVERKAQQAIQQEM